MSSGRTDSAWSSTRGREAGGSTIVDASGAVLGERACRDHLEARTYASTVRQHIYWLSPERFREYYRL